MAKLSLKELAALREKKKTELSRRDANKSVRINIGMGTCGIAAGARETFNAFIDELDKVGFGDAVVTQTGCLGQCHSEPSVEVHMPGMPDIVYGKVDQETARKIVRKHVQEKAMIQDHVYDKPSSDIVKE